MSNRKCEDSSASEFTECFVDSRDEDDKNKSGKYK